MKKYSSISTFLFLVLAVILTIVFSILFSSCSSPAEDMVEDKASISSASSLTKAGSATSAYDSEGVDFDELHGKSFVDRRGDYAVSFGKEADNSILIEIKGEKYKLFVDEGYINKIEMSSSTKYKGYFMLSYEAYRTDTSIGIDEPLLGTTIGELGFEFNMIMTVSVDNNGKGTVSIGYYNGEEIYFHFDGIVDTEEAYGGTSTGIRNITM